MTVPVVDRLKVIVAEELDINLTLESVDANAPLLEDGLGLDSIALVNLIELVEKHFNFQFSDDELFPENFSTLNVLAHCINSKLISPISPKVDSASIERTYGLDPQDYRDLKAKGAGIPGTKLGPNALLTQVGLGSSESAPKLVWIGGDIAQRLAKLREIDCYTLPSPGNVIKTQTGYIKKVSALYADELEAVYQQGPYVLGGYCFDGWFAFEIAQLLKQRQLQVPLVILLDITTSLKQFIPNIWLKHCQRVDGIHWLVRLSLQNLLKLNSNVRKRTIASRIQSRLNQLFSRHLFSLPKPEDTKTSDTEGDSIQADAAPWQSASVAIAQYHPKPYPGNLALLFAKDRSELFRSNLSWLFPYLGWRDLVDGQLRIQFLPTSHSGIHTDPDVDLAIEKIQIFLEEIKSDVGSHTATQHQSVSSTTDFR